jgi:hypothetical protein
LAVPFYLRHGYRLVGGGPVLFGAIPHAVMVKTLD